jgi:hypothetical protein
LTVISIRAITVGILIFTNDIFAGLTLRLVISDLYILLKLKKFIMQDTDFYLFLNLIFPVIYNVKIDLIHRLQRNGLINLRLIVLLYFLMDFTNYFKAFIIDEGYA